MHGIHSLINFSNECTLKDNKMEDQHCINHCDKMAADQGKEDSPAVVPHVIDFPSQPVNDSSTIALNSADDSGSDATTSVSYDSEDERLDALVTAGVRGMNDMERTQKVNSLRERYWEAKRAIKHGNEKRKHADSSRQGLSEVQARDRDAGSSSQSMLSNRVLEDDGNTAQVQQGESSRLRPQQAEFQMFEVFCGCSRLAKAYEQHGLKTTGVDL